MLYSILQFILLLIFPPLLLGIITKTKAVFAGRKGPSIFQPYFDLQKHFRKGFVISNTTSLIFKLAPLVLVISMLLCGLMLPISFHPSLIGFSGNIFLFMYLLAICRFFLVLAALDTGSPFEGMGAAREVVFASFAELAMFFALLIIVKIANSLQLDLVLLNTNSTIFQQNSSALIMVLFSVFIVLLAENSRIPFDDPNTHLELTMVHEVMILDHSGPFLGLLVYASSLRLFVLGNFIVCIIFDGFRMTYYANMLIYCVSLCALAVIIGVVESCMARIRLLNIPKFLITACIVSIFGLIFVMK